MLSTIILSIFLNINAKGYDLNPFCTDGCSVVGNRTRTSYLCCVDHDLAYWAGGSRSDRYRADGRFYNCLLKTESVKTAEAYASAVAMFGAPYWGLDWIGRPRFLELSQEEKEIVTFMTPEKPQEVFCKDNAVRASSVPLEY